MSNSDFGPFPETEDASVWARRFQHPSERFRATHDLARRSNAVGVVAEILSGRAVNDFGVQFRTSWEVIRCCLVTVYHIGPSAKPLEAMVRRELREHTGGMGGEAARALRALERLDPESIHDLVSAIHIFDDKGFEAAIALIRIGEGRSAAVLDVIMRSPKAAYNMDCASRFELKHGTGKVSVVPMPTPPGLLRKAFTRVAGLFGRKSPHSRMR